METYERIKTLGDAAKAEAEGFMQSLTTRYSKDNPAPPEEIQKGLQTILSKYETKGQANPGLVTGLLSILASAAAFSIYPPLGIATLAASAYVIYRGQRQTQHKTS